MLLLLYLFVDVVLVSSIFANPFWSFNFWCYDFPSIFGVLKQSGLLPIEVCFASRGVEHIVRAHTCSFSNRFSLYFIWIHFFLLASVFLLIVMVGELSVLDIQKRYYELILCFLFLFFALSFYFCYLIPIFFLVCIVFYKRRA